MNSQLSHFPQQRENLYPKPYQLPQGIPDYLTVDQAISQAPNIGLGGTELFQYNAKQFVARRMASELFHYMHPRVQENELEFNYSESMVSSIFRWGFHLREGLAGNPIKWSRPHHSVGTMDPQTYGLAYLVTLATFAKGENWEGSIKDNHEKFQPTLYWKFVELAPRVRYQIEAEMNHSITHLPKPVEKKSIETAIKEAEQRTA